MRHQRKKRQSPCLCLRLLLLLLWLVLLTRLLLLLQLLLLLLLLVLPALPSLRRGYDVLLLRAVYQLADQSMALQQLLQLLDLRATSTDPKPQTINSKP